MTRRRFIGAAGAVVGAAATGFTLPPLAGRADAAKLGLSRRLYVAVPGYGDNVTQGGVGVLVYDIDNGYQFVKRIPTPFVPEGDAAEQVTGIEASAALHRLYVATTERLVCFDLLTDQMLWNNELVGGCDRQSMTPDFVPPPGGSMQMYSPSFRLGYWNVVDPISGATLKQVTVTTRGAHNTLVGADGRRVYMASLNDPILHVVDTATNTEVLRVGPFTAAIRPFTVNRAGTLCYTNVNNFLGFGIGDLNTGQVLYQIPVQGFPLGQAPRHGTRCHGIGITPDGTELWLSDGPNHLMHIFDNTVFPPTQKGFVQLRSDPGWISFSIDGTLAYASTGEVFDIRTKQRVAALFDEVGRVVQSEKLLEVDFYGNPSRPLIAGDQFGIG
jgi:hypothetical protein